MKKKVNREFDSVVDEMHIQRLIYGKDVLITFLATDKGIQLVNTKIARSLDLLEEVDVDIPKRPLVPDDEKRIMNYFG